MPNGPRQLELWATDSGDRPRPVWPAAPAAGNATLARTLPAELRLGTSSWAFPGWSGLIYGRRHPTATLARAGLWAYARHPLLRTVGLDRTHYAPLPAAELAAYAADVPADFRFVVKAHEDSTLVRYPDLPRYGARAGQANPRFLDPGHAIDAVIGPMLAGLGAKAGPLVFQFARQATASLGSPERFAERLHGFLDALPRGPLYAIELRNPELVTRAYAQVLAATDASHCFNIHSAMIGLAGQRERLGSYSGPALVVRWMLGGGLDYEGARAAWAPFNRLAKEDLGVRTELVDLCARAANRSQPVYVIINNKAEGSAPLSVMRLAEQLLDQATGDGRGAGDGRPETA